MPVEVTSQKLTRFYAELHKMQNALHHVWNERGGKPAAGSPAEIEALDRTLGTLARSAGEYGCFVLVAADDHLTALGRLATEPTSALAPATCARSAIEASALCSWLMDPKAPTVERVARMYAYRYEGMTQQLKLKAKHDPELESLIDEMEREALKHGFMPIKKADRREGVAMKMPLTTHLIRSELQESLGYPFVDVYRFLSGVTHGHHFAARQFGFKEVEHSDPTSHEGLISTQPEPTSLALCGVSSLLAYGIALNRFARLYGWHEVMPIVERLVEDAEMKSIFESVP